jgi:hypothetical protein
MSEKKEYNPRKELVEQWAANALPSISLDLVGATTIRSVFNKFPELNDIEMNLDDLSPGADFDPDLYDFISIPMTSIQYNDLLHPTIWSEEMMDISGVADSIRNLLNTGAVVKGTLRVVTVPAVDGVDLVLVCIIKRNEERPELFAKVLY